MWRSSRSGTTSVRAYPVSATQGMPPLSYPSYVCVCLTACGLVVDAEEHDLDPAASAGLLWQHLLYAHTLGRRGIS